MGIVWKDDPLTLNPFSKRSITYLDMKGNFPCTCSRNLFSVGVSGNISDANNTPLQHQFECHLPSCDCLVPIRYNVIAGAKTDPGLADGWVSFSGLHLCGSKAFAGNLENMSPGCCALENRHRDWSMLAQLWFYWQYGTWNSTKFSFGHRNDWIEVLYHLGSVTFLSCLSIFRYNRWNKLNYASTKRMHC